MAFALGACGGEDEAIGSGDDSTAGTGADGGDGGDDGLPGSGWYQRRRLDIAPDVLGLGLTDVPVLVRVDSSRIQYDVTNEFTPDVRFYDGALATELSYEVERWIESGESLFWVRLPSIDDSEAGRAIYMYYGKSGLEDAQAPADVWAGGYVGVWHMAEGEGGEVADSSGNGNVGVLFGGGADLSTSSLAGAALSITANVSYLDVAHADSLDLGQTMTIEGWVSPDGVDDRARFLLRKRDAYAIESVSEGAGTPRGVVWFQESADRSVTAGAPLDSAWTHLALVFDGAAGEFSLYLDGELEETREPPSDPAASSTTNLEIGLEAIGLIDEVRVSNVVRSPDWLLVQRRSVEDTLFEFSAPETP